MQKNFQKLTFKKYGHLRPGTYDIESTRYDKLKNLISKTIICKKKKILFRY